NRFLRSAQAAKVASFAAGNEADVRRNRFLRSAQAAKVASFAAGSEADVRRNRFLRFRPIKSVQPAHLQSPQCAAFFALDVKLDRPAANRAVLDISRLIRSQIDPRIQALAAIGAAHCNELLGCQPPTLGRLPYRLETVELVDTRLVEPRDAPLEKV